MGGRRACSDDITDELTMNVFFIGIAVFLCSCTEQNGPARLGRVLKSIDVHGSGLGARKGEGLLPPTGMKVTRCSAGRQNHRCTGIYFMWKYLYLFLQHAVKHQNNHLTIIIHHHPPHFLLIAQIWHCSIQKLNQRVSLADTQ